MKFHSILATQSQTAAAVRHLIEQAGEFAADLGVLFASHHHGPDFEELVRPLHRQLNVRNLIGCTGESIIGPDREVEGQPAVVLWLAALPEVRVLPFLVDQEDLQGFEDIDGLIDRVGAAPDDDASFVILAEPYTFDTLFFLNYMDHAYPGRPKVGGMASGATERGQNRLFLNDQELRQGMVGVALSGPVRIDTVVCPGCRPIGKPYVVTKANVNIIDQLGGRDAHDVLKQVFLDAAPPDQEMMKGGVQVGVVIDEHLKDFGPGDFVVHNLLGVFEETKLAIGSLIRPGQTIQFHVQDAVTADTVMRDMLAGKTAQLNTAPSGGLLFSCNGRGRRMFSESNHDIGLVKAAFEDCQVAGFFAQGEIGPVGGRSFVHGLTSSLILFRDAT